MTENKKRRPSSREDLSSAVNGQPQQPQGTPSESAALPSVETSPLPPAQRSISVSLPPQSKLPTAFRVPESPSSATGEHASKAAKVAIPRLRKDDRDAISGKGGRHRVTHAYKGRQNVVACSGGRLVTLADLALGSGERPICKHCADFKIACFYADGKRDRAKK
ncbi:MAG: hypothetical protein Q9227_001709 [Pyrenula ochraceoflavens]